MTSPPLNHAELARLAHQALRLKENGIDSSRAIRDLAAMTTSAAPDEPVIIGAAGHPLSRIAYAVECVTADDLPGPTDPAAVERLMEASLSDIHQAWDEAVTANLEQTLPPDELAAWRDSIAADARAFEDRVAAMEETGDWPVHPAFGHARHTDGAANALYDLGREGILGATISVTVAVVKVVLVDSADYSVNLATHQFLSSVAGAGRVATTAALASKTVTAGVFDAADTVFSAVTGDVSESLILYQSSAVTGGADVADTSQRLIGYIDTATGLPVTPNTGDINVAWDSGANRIFKL
jgi:hypothetical protein